VLLAGAELHDNITLLLVTPGAVNPLGGKGATSLQLDDELLLVDEDVFTDELVEVVATEDDVRTDEVVATELDVRTEDVVATELDVFSEEVVATELDVFTDEVVATELDVFTEVLVLVATELEVLTDELVLVATDDEELDTPLRTPYTCNSHSE
jgi:hypothetical protein